MQKQQRSTLWGLDEPKVVVVVLAINVLMGVTAALNRGIWVRFVPEEFVGWFMLATGVVSYTWFLLHYSMVAVDRFYRDKAIPQG
ncbi:MAG: hypothetical protein ACR2PB_00735 [Desulfocapsaceae bacterium]